MAAWFHHDRATAALLDGATDRDLRDPFPAGRVENSAFDRHVRRAMNSVSDDAFDARIFEALDQLSRVSYGDRPRPPQASLRMQYVKRFIEKHLSQPLTLDRIASAIHVSPFVLIRQFKSAVKTTPHAYLVKCRLAEAHRLLRDERVSVADIATQVGIVDANYFARFFKRASGLSPTDYRLTVNDVHNPGPIRRNSATNAGFHVAQPSLEYCISKW